VDEFFGLIFFYEQQSSTDNATGNRTTTSKATMSGEMRSFTRVDDIFGRTLQKQMRNGEDEILLNNEYTYRDISGSRTTRQVSEQLITTVDEFGDIQTLAEYQMTYDDRGNISAIVQDGETAFRYEYDDANQLVREDNLANGNSTVYTYDAGGNMTNRTRYPFTLEDEFGEATSSEDFVYYGDILLGTADEELEIAYDEIGNALNWQGGSCYTAGGNSFLDMQVNGAFEWEGRNLARASGTGTLFGTPVTGELEYRYDADGLRTDKIIEMTPGTATEPVNIHYQYIWDNGRFMGYYINIPAMEGALSPQEGGGLLEMGGSFVMRIIYSDNGEALGYAYVLFDSDGSAIMTDCVWYIKNVLGDVQGLYSENLKLLGAYYTYDAWGMPTMHKSEELCGFEGQIQFLIFQITNQLTYRGYFYDFETGLYYLQSRYYSPTMCRFINADKHFDTGTGVLGTNMYIYCDNNPIAWTDHSGELGANKIESVTLKENCALENGTEGSITATVDYIGKTPTYKWKSSDSSVLKVTWSGDTAKLEPKKPGKAIVTCEADQGWLNLKKKDSCTVYVFGKGCYKIIWNGAARSNMHLYVGSTKKLKAEAIPNEKMFNDLSVGLYVLK